MGKTVNLDELIIARHQAKEDGQKVVFTNGCFDILHRGHVEYLQKAKALGDILIVGLNSDESVRILKGEKRPIISQEDRAFILAGLSVVDYVCIFDEDTPAELIASIVPDVLIKGGDYKIDEIVGRDTVFVAGGEVLTIEEIKGKATRSIIETIVERYK